MAIKGNSQHSNYAYRAGLGFIKEATFAATFPDGVVSGRFVALDADGYVVPSNGSKKSWMVVTDINNKRQTLSYMAYEKVVTFFGAYQVETDQYESAAAFTPGCPLKVSANGKLTPWVTGTDTNTELIVGYCVGIPAGGFITFQSK